MTPEEIYRIWAPTESVWSAWAIPVPFAQIICLSPDAEEMKKNAKACEINLNNAQDLAIVSDLPGGESIHVGLALALRGFRPVPAIDGSPGPLPIVASREMEVSESPLRSVAVDMKGILRGLCAGAEILKELTLRADARPAFLLDAHRMAEGLTITQGMFDNRWKAIPQDFPSGRLLMEKGIRRVLLIQRETGQPREDLAHVLLRWQEAGIPIFCADKIDESLMRPLQISRPSNFRSLWYRALAFLGLRRGAGGGFGAWPPESSGG